MSPLVLAGALSTGSIAYAALAIRSRRRGLPPPPTVARIAAWLAFAKSARAAIETAIVVAPGVAACALGAASSVSLAVAGVSMWKRNRLAVAFACGAVLLVLTRAFAAHAGPWTLLDGVVVLECAIVVAGAIASRRGVASHGV